MIHPNGLVEQREVPGTSDEAAESYPSVRLAPDGRAVVLTWARRTSAGSDILISRFDEGRWADPAAVTDSASSAGRSLTQVLDNGSTRVLWLDEVSGFPEFRTRLMGPDLAPLGPVEPLVPDATFVLDLDGTPGQTETPLEADTFLVFRANVFGRERIVGFGVRDVPSPIGGTFVTRIDFLMPADESGLARSPEATRVDGRLFVRAVLDGSLVYTKQEDASTWTELRTIRLGAISRAAAELLVVEEMLASDEGE